MPLKITCARCGELLYYASSFKIQSESSNLSVPDIIFGKLKGQCPSCKRIFTHDDVQAMQVCITGKPADAEFYAKGGKKKRQNRDRWLWIGNDVPARIEPVWQFWKDGRGKTERNQP